MIGLQQEAVPVGVAGLVPGIVARREHHPLEARYPVGCEIAGDIVSSQERHGRHRRARHRWLATRYRHFVPGLGEMRGRMSVKRTGAADDQDFHASSSFPLRAASTRALP